MEAQDNIELTLWEYIDGICDEATRVRVAGLVATDAAWKGKYEELAAFNDNLLAGLESEEPSVRFTKNVMDIIGQASVVPSVRAYINPVIIKSIAACLVVSLLITTLFAFFSAGPVDTAASVPAVQLPAIAFKAPDIASYVTSNTITVLLCVNVVLGLLFLDTILRRKARSFHQ